MKYRVIFIILILVLLNLNIKDWMTPIEILEFNLKLYLISNVGFIDQDEKNAKLLNLLTNDEILIKFHRRLEKKYKFYIKSYIITNKTNIYILNTELAKKILNDSPLLFDAGLLKENSFKIFMPKNLGISKCNSKNNCPWKKRREFNENVLGTQQESPFFKNIYKIISKHINSPLLTLKDYKKISSKIIDESLFGFSNNHCLLRKINNQFAYNTNVTKTLDFKKYTNYLNKGYNESEENSLLDLANKFKNENLNITNDQIPHWFSPFIFIINYLIPNLLCILLNDKNKLNKLKKEINNKNFNLYSKNSYLHYCVIEHIRLFNTININIQRTVKKNMVYENIEMKKRDQIFILFSSILRDEKIFENPDQFIPERWINKSVKSQEIVFGVGPQICPSKNITPIYYKCFIYILLNKYNYTDASPKLKNKEIYFINPYDIKFEINN